MVEPPATQMLRGRAHAAWITLPLALAAVVLVGFRLMLALGPEDTDPYESPLMLSVARQLVSGPEELYGPFGGGNPLVLIHAPLYYRCAALLAWPMARAGLHPAEAARLAGRAVSALGLVAVMGAAYRLGRLGGLPVRAGWWSALLVAAAPVVSGQAFTVRPDLAGAALQAWGATLALGSLCGTGGRPGAASVLFGLAACVKQHLVGAWAVSTAIAAAVRPMSHLASRLVLPGAIVVLLYFGAEWLVASGHLWEAAFVAAANVGRVHPGGWLHVATVVAAIVGKSAGLAALALAGAVAARPGSRGGFPVGANLLALAITLLAVAQVAAAGPWITGMLAALALVGFLIGLPAAAMPAGDGRVDAALGACCGVELILVVVLSYSSSGAWINYGIPVVVFAAVLAARSLARATEPGSASRRWILAAAAVAVLASAFMDVEVEAARRRAEHADLARVFAAAGVPPPAIFFADRPGLNRMTGRLEWVYDAWLYPAFESRKLAEPRGRWLRRALGPPAGARAVVLESDSGRVDGIAEPLSALGFRLEGRVGPFRVWTFDPRSPGPR
jgi:hypothetical protein